MAYSPGKAVVSAPARVANAQSVESLSQEAKFFAHLSSVAYYEPPQRPLRQNKFDLDLEFNTDRFAVYTLGGWLSAKAVVVAFRGTSDMSDERNDLLLASDTNVNRLQQLLASEVECIGAVARKYPEARIHVTGHSLGGTIAMFVAVHTGLVFGGHIFNPGAGVKTEELLVGAVAFVLGAPTAGILRQSNVLKVEELASRINTHHVLGDPLSMLFSLGNIQCYSPTKANLHTLTNFIDEDPPSTHGMFDDHSHGEDVYSFGKGVGAATARVRGRTGSPKREGRSHNLRFTCARRVHSHSGAGGWTEVLGHVNNVTEHSLMKRLVMPSNEGKDGCSALDAGSDWMVDWPLLGHTTGAVERPSMESLIMHPDNIEEDWRSAVDVGTMVKVLALGSEGLGHGRKWVEAEVVVARPKVLTLKWLAGDGGGEIFRRVARDSAEIRSCVDHADTLAAGDVSVSVPEVIVQEELVADPLPDESWRLVLEVGSVAELWVKRQWIRAEVSIAREKVLTMKWIDSQDGAEACRRIARNTSDLRPCQVKMAPR